MLCHDEQMNFADNWARVLVVITFLTFGEAQIAGGIVPNLIAFGSFDDISRINLSPPYL